LNSLKYKIGIDARELEKSGYGVARYIRNVINSLISCTDDLQLYLYFKEKIPDLEFLNNEKVKLCQIKLPGLFKRDIIWQQIYLPKQLKKDGIDLFFSGQYTIPYNIKIPSICVVHDLSYFVNPRWFPFREGFLLRLLSRISLRKATKIIASSDITAKDINKYLSIKQDRIITNYPGLSENFFSTPKSGDNAILLKYSIKSRYILWIGSILNRRKIELLLSAYEEVAKDFDDVNLVIIGKERCSPKIELKRKIDNHPFSERITYIEYIQENELISFYDNAILFVFLSVYEGFGYTPLEGALRKLPIILYENPTFKEIFGNYAEFISDKCSLVKAIKNCILQVHLKSRIQDFITIIEEKYRADVNNKNIIAIINNVLH